MTAPLLPAVSRAANVCVRLLDFPAAAHTDWREHYDELLREFSLLVLPPRAAEPGHELPFELLEVVSVLHRYGAGPLESGRSIGTSREYDVPVAARPAISSLLTLLGAADEYCRSERLLTLPASAAQRRFRTWFLGSFVDQLAGADPVPWSAA